MAIQIVLDTNVLISALRSQRGASFKLVSLIGLDERFEINVSTPLVLEYEDVAKRPEVGIELSFEGIDYLYAVANRCQIFFL